MSQVDVFEAKSTLSKLVDLIERGEQTEIVIARNGRPAAKLVPVQAVNTTKRLGAAKGKFQVPDDIDAHYAEVARLFNGED